MTASFDDLRTQGALSKHRIAADNPAVQGQPSQQARVGDEFVFFAGNRFLVEDAAGPDGVGAEQMDALVAAVRNGAAQRFAVQGHLFSRGKWFFRRGRGCQQQGELLFEGINGHRTAKHAAPGGRMRHARTR